MEQLITQSKKPLHLYFGEDLVDTPEALDNANNIINEIPCVVKWCTSLDDLSKSISENPRNIAVHIDIVRRHGGTISEFMMMLETMIKYANISDKPNIAIVIESDTHLLTIKELQKHKITGIIPSAKSFNKQECITAIILITDGQRYWPKDIISRLPGNENKIKNKNSNALTSRQQEVFDLIANRGLSNKQIARVLNISESTVKIHVSAVMKNLCVRNRTQLALTK
jgi:DNA-binding NarL/FixJ family response regulator